MGEGAGGKGVIKPVIGGCDCDAGGGSPAASGLFALGLLGLAVGRARTRRVPRRTRRVF